MESDKVFNDPIHGSIQMPLYCQWIIDTPEFQRLRYIKQLGCTSYVYPSAVHTIFEHSIGVSHLAGILANVLKQNDGSKIQDNEVACVEIAGLCHDLGQGPFSEAFRDIASLSEPGRKWSPDDQSVVVFEHLIEKNHLKKSLEEYGIYEQEIKFICELILGHSLQPDAKLIRENKLYLYQIVHNTVNGVDVNKWDSFARDAHYLGIQSAFNFNRIIPFVKVFDVRSKGGSRKELCFRDKVASDLNHMFLTRRRLHYASYQHRVANIITIMLKDAFLEASDHLKFIGHGGVEYSLLESVRDPEAFCQVNDSIINEIMRSRSNKPGMQKAREIIDRIHKRQLYQCIVEIQHANEVLRTVDVESIKRCVVDDDDDMMLISTPSSRIWRAENIEVEVSYFDYGKGDENPLLHIPFYKKTRDNGKEEVGFIPESKLPSDLPQRFQDITVRIYTKVPCLERPVLEQARNYFHDYLRTKLHRPLAAPRTPSRGSTSSFCRSPLVGTGSILSTPPIGAVSPLSSSLASPRDERMCDFAFTESSDLEASYSTGLMSDPGSSSSSSSSRPRPIAPRSTSALSVSSPEPEASVTHVTRQINFDDQ